MRASVRGARYLRSHAALFNSVVGSSTSASALSLLAADPAASSAAASAVASSAARLRRAFGAAAPADAGAAGDGAVLSAWVQSYYRRPRPDLLVPALSFAGGVPGSWTGAAAFGGAVFLGTVARAAAPSAAEVTALVEAASSAAAARVAAGGDFNRCAEQLDTLLRGLRLAGGEGRDALLARVSAAWRDDVLAHPGANSDAGGAAEPLADLLALADSLAPPAADGGGGARAVGDPLLWPVPALDLPAFERHIAAEPLSPYGATRYLLLHTRAGHALAAAPSRRAAWAEFAPALAATVTAALVDGYWSRFYATGDPATLVRVLDVGALYLPFADEYGDAPLLLAAPPGAPPGAWVADLADDALAAMRFEAGRYALWTLLANAQVHTQVGGWFLRQAGDAADAAALLDPFSRAAELSHADEQRLLLQRLLAPAIRNAYAHAQHDGIGSGLWPAEGSVEDAVSPHADADPDASPLHGAAAQASEPLESVVAALLRGGAKCGGG